MLIETLKDKKVCEPVLSLAVAGACFLEFGYPFLHSLKFSFGIGPDQDAFWWLGYFVGSVFALLMLSYPLFNLVRFSRPLPKASSIASLAKSLSIGVLNSWFFFLAYQTISALAHAPHAVGFSLFISAICLVVLEVWAILIALPVLLLLQTSRRLKPHHFVVWGGLSAVLLLLWMNVDLIDSEKGSSSFGRSLGDVRINGNPTPLGWLILYIQAFGVVAFGVVAGFFAASQASKMSQSEGLDKSEASTIGE